MEYFAANFSKSWRKSFSYKNFFVILQTSQTYRIYNMMNEMKKLFSLSALIVVGILFTACPSPKEKTSADAPQGEEVASAFSEEEKAMNDSFFMLQDGNLPQSIDLKQDISHLNYQNLRLLRSYVYALHAHWFMEGDLNTFFSKHTDWYESLMAETWYDLDEATYKKDSARITQYCEALVEDYPSSYKMIRLSPEEQQFLERIDERMELLKKDKYLEAEEGTQLLNPDLGVNWCQLWQPEERMHQLMREWNVAFEPTKYEQLFNVYENNDYMGMPNFVTTDLFLQAFHMYFSYVLKSLEAKPFENCMRSAFLDLLLECCREMECCSEMQESTVAWVSAYCMVGLRLLGYDPAELLGKRELSVENAFGEYKDFLPLVEQEVKLVMEAEDTPSPLFQTRKNFNYSLFRPRGHYNRSDASQRYFRAMMWLQKGCFMRESPEQLDQAISMARVLNASSSAQEELRKLNQALTFLMGTPDNVSLTELAAYMREKGIEGRTAEEQKQLDDWLKEIFHDRNRIAPKQKLDFQDEINLMPQRYTLDGEILGTIYDPQKNAEKAYPSGLDVMDVLGSEAAHALVDTLCKPQEQWKDYAKERKQIGERMTPGMIGWDLSMYNKWMQCLLELQKQYKQQPSFMQTKAWKLKNLNTALASWALLKHDAILYAEQPMGAECGGGGMPEPVHVGYVEPNVSFWERMLEMLQLNKKVLDRCGFLSMDLSGKTLQLEGYVEFCLNVSKKELENQPLSPSDFATIQHIGASMEWFTLSVVDPEQTFDLWDEVKGSDRCIAQVADVFTRNILDCPKDGILYEATGLANAIYVMVEIQGEYYLTRGATYSYYEFVRPMGERLTDDEWQQMLQDGKAPAQPEWFTPWLLGKPVESDERFIYQTGC